MPIPQYDGSPEQEWISSCMHEIGNEYDQEQALAICYKQMEMSTTELQEEDVQAIWDRLPEPEKGELEETYVDRCIPTLYPSDYDQQQAASFCADHYSNRVTIGLRQQIFGSQKDTTNSVANKIKGIKLY